jgi:hypothetical protein
VDKTQLPVLFKVVLPHLTSRFGYVRVLPAAEENFLMSALFNKVKYLSMEKLFAWVSMTYRTGGIFLYQFFPFPKDPALLAFFRSPRVRQFCPTAPTAVNV